MERIISIIEDFVYCKAIIPNQISKNLNTLNPDQTSTSTHQENLKINEIDLAFNDLRNQIRQLIFEISDEKVLKTQIRKLQKYIIDLLIHSFGIAELFDIPIVDENPIRKAALLQLDNHLYYLENFHRVYLDENFPCSNRTNEIMAKKIISNIRAIEDLLQIQTYQYNYKKVVQKICETAAKLVKDKSASYFNLKRNTIILAELGEIVSSSNHDFKKIKKYLLGIDYADRLFIKSLKEEIKALVMNPNSIPLILENLHCHLRMFKQLKQNPKEYMYTNEITTKDYIIEYIQEEISCNNLFLEKESKINNLIGVRQHEKILSNMTVEQISLLSRLVVKCKLVDEPNNTKFFQFISNNFYTKKQAEISSKSVKAKYYNSNESTSKAVKQYLEQMLFELNEEIINFS